MFPQHIPCFEIRSDQWAGHDASPDIEALAESIRRHGVLRPILVRATPDGYVLVHGERRLRAARAAGLDAIPAFLVEELASAG